MQIMKRCRPNMQKKQLILLARTRCDHLPQRWRNGSRRISCTWWQPAASCTQERQMKCQKHGLYCSSWCSVHARVQGSHSSFCADCVHILEFVHGCPRRALLLLAGTRTFLWLACINGFPENWGSLAYRNLVGNKVEASADDIGFVDEKNRSEGQNIRFRGVLVQRAAVDHRYRRIMSWKRYWSCRLMNFARAKPNCEIDTKKLHRKLSRTYRRNWVSLRQAKMQRPWPTPYIRILQAPAMPIRTFDKAPALTCDNFCSREVLSLTNIT